MRKKLFMIYNRKEDAWYCYSDLKCIHCPMLAPCPKSIKIRPWSLRPKGEMK